MHSKIKLNIGCGETKLEGYINIDIEASVDPDLICDVRKGHLPFKDQTVQEIYCIHNIEHIEYRYWQHVFFEFYRVLQKGGNLVLFYPEFEVCAKNFITNKSGQRDFWRATLYGRQLYPGDYHVTPVISSLLMQQLRDYGFQDFKQASETDDYYTILGCSKGKMNTMESLFREHVFNIKEVE